MNFIKKALIPTVLLFGIVGTSCKQTVKEEKTKKK